MSTISIVVAMDSNRVIGLDNRLPWRLPSDVKHFRKVTMGKAVIMGRHTYESIGKPLEGRHNIVLTRNEDYTAKGCTVANSLEEGLQAAGSGEIMIIGGSGVYEQVLPLADRIYLTIINGQFQGDTFFPPVAIEQWRAVSWEICPADDKNPYDHAFILLERPKNRK